MPSQTPAACSAVVLNFTSSDTFDADDEPFLNSRWSCVRLGGVFERQIAVALWSDRAAAGEAANQTVHSDNIQSKVSVTARESRGQMCKLDRHTNTVWKPVWHFNASLPPSSGLKEG